MMGCISKHRPSKASTSYRRLGWRHDSSASNLPDGLRYMAVACDEERAYTFGGETAGFERINDVYEVDLTSLVCSKIQPI